MTKGEAMDRTATQFMAAKALNEATPLDEAELDRLALMPPIEYGQVRKQVADQLGTAVAYLDATVTARKKELTPTANVGSGRPLEMWRRLGSVSPSCRTSMGRSRREDASCRTLKKNQSESNNVEDDDRARDGRSGYRISSPDRSESWQPYRVRIVLPPSFICEITRMRNRCDWPLPPRS